MKRAVHLCLIFCSLGAGQASAVDTIEILTQNQYLGANLAPVLANPDPVDFNEGLVTLLKQVSATDAESRIRRQATQIARRLPDLVGLQEVWELRCVDLGPPVDDKGCNDPAIAHAFGDHLTATLEALDALGASYRPVATVTNLDLTTITVDDLPPGIPFLIDGFPAVLVALERDVILARSDVAAEAVDLTPFQPLDICLRPSADGCNYRVVAETLTPAGLVAAERGFVAVDATVDGKDYRLVSTHLELTGAELGDPLLSFFQAAQALELIETLAATTPPERTLIVTGDFNSSPEHPVIPGPLPLPPPFDAGITPPYLQFLGGGYTDAWELRPGRLPGFTCCQLADLSNRRSILNERIDMIFSLTVPDKVRRARVLGDRIADKTRPIRTGLWPSDHGALAASLKFR